jgi:hypothetical protein
VLGAARLYAESLALNQSVNDRRSLAACLVGLASVAAAQSRPIDAVHLLAAATVLLDRLSAALLPADQAEYERSLNALRSSLDAPAFDAAWREGAALTLQDAVACALTSSQFAHLAPNA